jgi:hypothetical protein
MAGFIEQVRRRVPLIQAMEAFEAYCSDAGLEDAFALTIRPWLKKDIDSFFDSDLECIGAQYQILEYRRTGKTTFVCANCHRRLPINLISFMTKFGQCFRCVTCMERAERKVFKDVPTIIVDRHGKEKLRKAKSQTSRNKEICESFEKRTMDYLKWQDEQWRDE